MGNLLQYKRLGQRSSRTWVPLNTLKLKSIWLVTPQGSNLTNPFVRSGLKEQIILQRRFIIHPGLQSATIVLFCNSWWGREGGWTLAFSACFRTDCSGRFSLFQCLSPSQQWNLKDISSLSVWDSPDCVGGEHLCQLSWPPTTPGRDSGWNGHQGMDYRAGVKIQKQFYGERLHLSSNTK